MPQTFRQKFHEKADQRSPFCLGIDPTPNILAAWNMDDNPQGLRDFCDRIVPYVSESIALVKPQSACFERFGAAGAIILEQFIEDCRAAGILVLLDAKRGDIAATNISYAQAFFDPKSPMRVDAITAHPFLGFDDLMPLIDAAQKQNGAVFVVAASSNIGAAMVQSAKTSTGESLTENLARHIAQHEAAAAVVGATRDDLTADTLACFGDSLLLTPGNRRAGSGFFRL